MDEQMNKMKISKGEGEWKNNTKSDNTFSYKIVLVLCF